MFAETAPLFLHKVFWVFEELKTGTRSLEHACTDVNHMDGSINFRPAV